MAAVALAASGHAYAAPTNDSFASATEIGAYPFADAIDLDGASTEPGEPQACNFQSQSVWYRIAPAAAAALRIGLSGSDFGAVLTLYRSFGSGIGGLGFQNCLGFGGSRHDRERAGRIARRQRGHLAGDQGALARL